MDEKLKSENMQKKKFSEWGVGVGVMKFSSPQAAMGTNPPPTKILRTLVPTM